MLESLHIENVAVIECADVDFRDKLNILTGETGAGKSILIDAINAVLGERIRRDMVRTGCDEARVFATFSDISASAKTALADAGYPCEDTLLISRTIRADGKSSCRIDGRPATVTLLREVGRILVNIHGQHENQTLLDAGKHLMYLEKLGDFSAVRGAYKTAYHAYCDVSRELKKLDMADAEKQYRLDMLRFTVDELEAAAPQIGEMDTLEEKCRLFRQSEKIVGYLRRATAILSGEDGAVSAVTDAAENLRHAGGLYEKIVPTSARLDSLMYDLEACSTDVDTLLQELQFDEETQAQMENRLDLLRRLCKKHTTDEAGLIALLESSRAQLHTIETADARADELRAQLDVLRQQTVSAAEKLTAARHATARKFEQRVAEELSFLDMPGVQFKVEISPVALTVTGGDKVEFLLSANIGEPAKPIASIASGGELSRIMLAIKAVMADADDIDTLIFDEIDTGISGRAAVKVGTKLREIAAHRQVLCVTHLAQIAARAHRHLFIQKDAVDGRTSTKVTTLDSQGREDELARIIGGGVSDANRAAAREMLREGQEG